MKIRCNTTIQKCLPAIISRSKRTPGLYTFEEAQLIKLYNQYSDRTDKWKIIAAKLNRTHQSVRGQYVNHLDETIDKSELTKEEKLKIDDLQTNPRHHNKYYKKWSEIAKKLSENRKQGRRTELQVKNYWNSKERSQKRKSKSEEKSYERISKIMNINYIMDC
ncbi:hypothetical protein RclHR1_02600006 [Rhizophagus clarus]|uniref:Myb-like domain-containing protein n=1 Tax=Rhizophagus clarus TaxID=94130 RepID=A0A2Z6QZY8_9GLOM|nr:hypothetical protein RclHR1_02600006 [Rhizophagus clarus]